MLNLRPPAISSDRTLLRLGQSRDIPAVIQYYVENAEHLKEAYPELPSAFFSENFWRDRLEKSKQEFNSDKSLRLFLFARSNGTLIGTVNFTEISRGPFHACFLGYGIAKDYEGQGLMFEAVSAAIAFVFREMNLHRIMANYQPHNERSGRLLKRLGFQVEGYARDYLRIQGRWTDHILTSILNSHWQPY